MVLGVRSALPKTAPVVVAKGYLDVAAEMTEETVETKLFPISAIPEGVASDLSEVVGKEIGHRINPGEFIFLDRLRPKQNYNDFIYDAKVISFEVDESNFDPEDPALEVGERVSLSKNGQQIFGRAQVYEIDLANGLISLLMSNSAAEMANELRKEPGVFQVSEPAPAEEGL